MKCLEKDKLISYAYRLMDQAAASEVRAHLGECSQCRDKVGRYGRLDSLLDEWKAAGPTPEFDVRVRQAVEARQAGRPAWNFWNWGWSRGLALASLAVLLAAGAVWFPHGQRRTSSSANAAARPSRTAAADPAPAQVASLHAPGTPANTTLMAVKHAPGPGAASAASAEDKETLTLEDYDMAANFDVLSELPKGDSRLVN
ncbi:MAG: anti-sigma factor family protein [Terriglobia bacterium]